MDDIDHVLNHLRQQYSYRLWALVGHSRGNFFCESQLTEGANAAFQYAVMRDRSIPLIVNCSGRFMSELLKTRIEQFYPGGLQSGSYLEKWSLPGGKYRERLTPAEEILNLSSIDNKIGISSSASTKDISGSVTSFCICVDHLWVCGSCSLTCFLTDNRLSQ